MSLSDYSKWDDDALTALTGSIPAALSACTDVTDLNFYKNSLTGSIPVELSAMTSMVVLQLWSNSLTGIIPVELSAMTSLEVLNLFYNALTGSIPAELSALTSLDELELAPNSLTGAVPEFLCNSALSDCVLIDGSGSNQFSCSSAACDNGWAPCNLANTNFWDTCYEAPTPQPTAAPTPKPTAAPAPAPTSPTPAPTSVDWVSGDARHAAPGLGACAAVVMLMGILWT